MATFWTLGLLVTGLVCVGQNRVTGSAELAELRVRLTTLEANQQSARDSLLQLGHEHIGDVENVTHFCQDLKSSVREQAEVLKSIQEALKDELCKNDSQKVDQSGACHPDNHTIINDRWRAITGVYDGYNDMCDKEIAPGWYRFLLHRKTAVIPTSCVPKNNCQTDAPTWVDLQGQSLPRVGKEINARACSHWEDNCCHWEAPIVVRNCGDFLVYKIEPLVTCDLAFCVEKV